MTRLALFRSVSFVGPLLLLPPLNSAAQSGGDLASSVVLSSASTGEIGLLAANAAVRFAPDVARDEGRQSAAPAASRWLGILSRSASRPEGVVATGWRERLARRQLDGPSLRAALPAQPATERRCVHGWRWTIIGTAAGFGVGFWAGFGAFDEAINSDQKIWTTAIIGGAAGGIVGYLADRQRATCTG